MLEIVVAREGTHIELSIQRETTIPILSTWSDFWEHWNFATQKKDMIGYPYKFEWKYTHESIHRRLKRHLAGMGAF
jgi:hypothetical protein